MIPSRCKRGRLCEFVFNLVHYLGSSLWNTNEP